MNDDDDDVNEDVASDEVEGDAGSTCVDNYIGWKANHYHDHQNDAINVDELNNNEIWWGSGWRWGAGLWRPRR